MKKFPQILSILLVSCLQCIFLSCQFHPSPSMGETVEGVADSEFNEDSLGIKNRVKRVDQGGIVLIANLTAELAQAKKDIAQLKAEFGLADAELDLFLQNINSTLNFDFAVNTAKARLYSEKNHLGLSEDYNVAEDYYGVGCQNLSGLLSRVRSIDPFDSCVRVFSRPDCHGHTIVFYPGSLYHGDVERIFSNGIKSIGPCFSLPYGKRYPDDLYEGIVKNEDMTRKMQEQLDTLHQQVNDQQMLLEQLSHQGQGGNQVGSIDLINFGNDTVSSSPEAAINEDVWNTCGGLLSLSTTRDLSYTNKLDHNHTLDELPMNQTCVWLIWARNGGPVVITLVDLFKPASSSSSLNGTNGLLSLHQIYQDPSSTIVRKIDLIETGRDYGMNDSTILVVFKSSVKGQGFTLRMRDLSRNRRNRDFRVTANFLRPHPSSLLQVDGGMVVSTRETFTHPQFHGQEYLPLEKRHIFIEGVVGKKIHLQIDFVYTEEVLDSLDVFKFSRNENKFLFLRSYSGRWRRLTHENFLGDESEPMFLYFDSDASIEDLGFQISYTHQWANESSSSSSSSSMDQNLANNRTIQFSDYGDYDDFEIVSIPPETSSIFENCGGLVTIPEFSEIFFKNSNATTNLTCVWLIWGKYGGGPVALTLAELNGGSSADSQLPKLTIQAGLSFEGSTKARILTEQNIGNETVEISLEPFTLLVFTSSGSGQGFRLKLRDLRQLHWRANRIVDLTSIDCHGNNNQYSYPPIVNVSEAALSTSASQKYLPYERRFFVVTPHPNERIDLTLSFVDTEPSVDLIRVYRFSGDENNFQFLGRFSGRFGSEVDAGNFHGNSDEPMLLYFISDSSGHGSGFKMDYSCQNDSQQQQEQSNEFQNEPKFGPCGGHIVLTNETELAYQNEGGQSAEGEDEETCIWLISCPDDGIIGVTMVTQNYVNANATTILTLQSGFNTLNSSTISTSISKTPSELIHEKPYALLVFSSRTGDHFHLRLRQLGKTRWSRDEPRDDEKEVTLSTFRLTSGDSDTYAYPGDDWSTYRDHERRFLILEPAQNEQMGVSIKFIDTEANYDYLTIFKYSKYEGKFLFVQKFTGDAGELHASWLFRGLLNEPMLVYFHSDGSKPGHGFRLSYTSQMVTSDSPPQVEDGAIIGPVSTIRQGICGGLIPVDGQVDLIYKNNNGQTRSNDSDNILMEENCVFILWAKRGGPFEVTLIDLEGSAGKNYSNSSTPTLSLQRRFGEQRASIGHLLQIEDKNVVNKINATVLILVFTSLRGGQGFRLRLGDQGENMGNRNWKVSANFLAKKEPGQGDAGQADDPTLFSYPHSPGRLYMPMERRHVILKSYPGYRTQISVDFVSTESSMGRWGGVVRDFLTIFKFSKKDDKFLYLRRFSGPSNQLRSTPIFQGLENQPLLIYFHSDGSVQDRGFKIFYSYHKVQKNDSTFDEEEKVRPEIFVTSPPTPATQKMELATQFEENFDNDDPEIEKPVEVEDDEKNYQKSTTTTPINPSNNDQDILRDPRVAEALKKFEDELMEKIENEQGHRTPHVAMVPFTLMASLSLLISLVICGMAVWKMTQRRRGSGGQFFGNFINYSRMLSGSENILLETHHHQHGNENGVLEEG